MTSPARIWYPNTSCHITSTGNGRSDIFKDDEDFQIYLNIIEETMEYFSNDYEVICYCLMDNHIHILLKTKERHMKDFMARVNSIYAKFFNDKYNYVGHLYQDRYFAELIESDSQMLDISRYIHLNPVKANMVEKPGEYQWSSYSMYIGEKRREVPFKGEVIEAVKEYLEGERRRNKFVESEFLILTNRATRMDRDAINKILNKLEKRLDIRFYPHKFRHTFCTTLLKRGVELTTVAKLAGHASIQTTASFYINTSAKDKRTDVELL